MIDSRAVEALMKRCQIGVGGRDALDRAHDIMAECYGTLGAMLSERDALIAKIGQDRRCDCSLATKLVGDGCEICNPAKALEYAKQTIADLEERIAKLEGPGKGDDIACEKCGAVALDTGLECSECGHDNHEAVTGVPFVPYQGTNAAKPR